jgi:hypothetical protein
MILTLCGAAKRRFFNIDAAPVGVRGQPYRNAVAV